MSENAAERFDDTREIVARNLQLRRHRASSDARVLQLSLAKVWKNGAEARTSRTPERGARVEPDGRRGAAGASRQPRACAARPSAAIRSLRLAGLSMRASNTLSTVASSRSL